MPAYLHKASLYDFLKYYTDKAETVTFVDLEENRAFGWGSGNMFSLREIKDILDDGDERYIALWREKEKPADAANIDEPVDG